MAETDLQHYESAGLAFGKNLTNAHYLGLAMDRTGGAGVPGAIAEQRAVVSRGREVMLQALFAY